MDYEGRDLGLSSKTWDFAHCAFLGRTAQVRVQTPDTTSPGPSPS
ncbi:MAG TPA: hypothetical protein VFB21_16260 [Chthonomonadaceae bacterium]|nr:hypothetical protein [Chthonomonadaceae bacterium]